MRMEEVVHEKRYKSVEGGEEGERETEIGTQTWLLLVDRVEYTRTH